MSKIIFITLFSITILCSCVSLNIKNPGVGRVKKYEFTHPDIPISFDGFRIVFLSDFHYKSLFTEKRLNKLISTVNKYSPDIILLGGDYHNGCQFVPELFEGISQMKTRYGIFAVLGNHDYNACYEEITMAMSQSGIQLLEHKTDTIKYNNEKILITGIRNPFDLVKNGRSPTVDFSPDDFVILLVHTPDYAEDVEITNTDIVFAGHTHGGQITVFGLYAPETSSRYGQRFRTGLKYTSDNIPVIITNGLGTSRKKMRIFAPSEIVVVTLRYPNKGN